VPAIDAAGAGGGAATAALAACSAAAAAALADGVGATPGADAQARQGRRGGQLASVLELRFMCAVVDQAPADLDVHHHRLDGDLHQQQAPANVLQPQRTRVRQHGFEREQLLVE
jgi:hypothetical protein